MTYLVLARKWRPRSFDTLVGQDHVVKALTHALSTQRLHHAWLFTGTRGVGKTTLSRLLAKSLNCETGITPTPCGTCRACTEIDTGRFVDYVELDAASNRGVDEMTQLLEQAVYAPGAGRFKVYMIDEVHMLSGHAFNAMLKTLEEPPPHVKFILATTDPQKIPVTVLSRCLQFNLKQMTAESIVGHLQHILAQEEVPCEVPALRLLAQAAAGSMRDALSLTDQAIAYSAGNLSAEAVQGMLGTIDNTHLVSLLQALARGHAPGVLAVADHLVSRGLSFQAALADLAILLSRIAIEQRVPGTVPSDDPQAEHITVLAGQLAPDALQLFYTVAVHSRHELSLAPDDYAGFVMACLRMLALVPEGQALPPVAPVPPKASVAPSGAGSSGTASGSAPAASAPEAGGPAAVGTPVAVQPAPAASPNLSEPGPAAVTPTGASSRPPPWEDEPVQARSAQGGQAEHVAQPQPAGAPVVVVAPEEGPSNSQPPPAPEPAIAPKVAKASEGAHHDAPSQALASDPPYDDTPYDDPPFDDESAFDGYIPDDEPLSGHLPVEALPVPQAGRAAHEAAPRRAPRLARMTPGEWPELAMALPLTGLAAELARQSEWLKVEGNCVHLRVGIRTLAESSAQSRLRTVLSEHFGTVVQVQVNWGATGDDTAHAVTQARLAALQQQAEQAVANDPLIHTLVQQFDARVLPGSIRAGARAALSA